MKNKICPECRAILHAPDDVFCYKDGTRLEERPAHDCGRELGPHDKFCPKCGRKV